MTQSWKQVLAATKKLKDYIKEIPKYDYAKVASSKEETGQVNKSSVKKPATVKRRKRATVAAGGC